MKPRPLEVLINLANEARDSASKMLASKQRDYQHINRQIDQLIKYRQEYRDQLRRQSAQGIDLTVFQEYQRFLTSLDSAIYKAKEQLLLHDQQVSQLREVWQQKQQRLTSYDMLAERRQMLQIKEEQSREQRMHDELTINSIARRWMSSADGDSVNGE